ncbi:MAG: bifunctional DNA-formamidopyrimidine glycosylase/DNA-(apurinic or apyrimidinic site) lyase [Lentisphaeria bacterium]|nr:bifunctional DNA-formamidopyrimidine glycosylase/DNA-(apurinic or apyrimidinic site) lyase [Lentisphaeria bacterium]
MPELPEVETISRALAKGLTGLHITATEVFSPKLRTPIESLKTAPLCNKKILGVDRRGRYSLVRFEDDSVLLMHYGMSGVVRIEAPAERRKHEHIFFHLSNGMIMKFECPRRFSQVEYFKNDDIPVLKKLGIEPLSDEFDGNFLYNAAQKKRTPAKLFITDNAVVTGVGNIYAAEVLFAAKVHPQLPADKLTLKQCVLLAENIKRILNLAIECGGSTISDFRHVDGSQGAFARELKIYGRDGEKCTVCQSVIQRIVQGGRSSFYCPECQKMAEK